MKNKLNIIWVIALLILNTLSCKDYIEVGIPENRITSDAAFASDITATAALTDIYANISNSNLINQTNIHGISFWGSLSADEMTLFSGTTDLDLQSLYKNSINAYVNTGASDGVWKGAYALIFKLNSSLFGLEKSTTLTPTVKSQLVGEAKFMRAFCYFYLVNLYGDVPLIVNLDYERNSDLPRAPKMEIYNQIVKDLNDAKLLLNTNYLNASMAITTERVRPTTWAASALLARVFLYMGSLGNNEGWKNAESESSRVIGNNSLFDLLMTPLANVFLKNSKEAIFQLQPTQTGYNTQEGRQFVLPSGGPTNGDAHLSNSLLASFENGDPRKSIWIKSVLVGASTYYFPFKYQKGRTADNTITSIGQMSEYSMVLRIAEQYLIRAEARAMQDKLDGQDGAIADINAIRSRARSAVPGSIAPANIGSGLAKNVVLDLIARERRAELFCEWGDRWLNIKRNGTIDAVMNVGAPEKGSVWSAFQQWYPIPEVDRKMNPNLTQNQGY